MLSLDLTRQPALASMSLKLRTGISWPRPSGPDSRSALPAMPPPSPSRTLAFGIERALQPAVEGREGTLQPGGPAKPLGDDHRVASLLHRVGDGGRDDLRRYEARITTLVRHLAPLEVRGIDHARDHEAEPDVL